MNTQASQQINRLSDSHSFCLFAGRGQCGANDSYVHLNPNPYTHVGDYCYLYPDLFFNLHSNEDFFACGDGDSSFYRLTHFDSRSYFYAHRESLAARYSDANHYPDSCPNIL